MARFSPEVDAAIRQASQDHGIPEARLRAFARIESGGNPRNQTGSYKGLFQLSQDEFGKHGGQGDIFDPASNANAAAAKFKTQEQDFARRYGRAPTDGELYMIHQQGVGGSAAHASNPDAPAWRNMASTAEGRQKGDGWAKQAIWGNVPDDMKAQIGSVDNLTSKQFTEMWNAKVARFGGDATPGQPEQTATASLATAPAPQGDPAPTGGMLGALFNEPSQTPQPSGGLLNGLKAFSETAPRQQQQQTQNPLDEKKDDSQAPDQPERLPKTNKAADMRRALASLQARVRLGTA